jgi:hypothetical protein
MAKASTIPKVRFNLKKYKDKDGEQQIVAVFRYPQQDRTKPRLRLLYHTGIKVLPKYWNGKEAKESVHYPQGKKTNDALIGIKMTIDTIYAKSPIITLEDFRNEIDYKRGRKERPEALEADRPTFLQFIDFEIEKHKVRVNGLKGGQTWQKYDSLKKRLELFTEETGSALTYESINEDFKDAFVLYLEKKKLSQNTISKDIETVKTLLRRSKRHHNNSYYSDDTFKVARKETTKHYPTLDELKKLYHHKFENETYQKVADLYLLSAFGGGLRISDILRLDKSALEQDDEGDVLVVYTWKGRDVKEDNQVVIPVTPQVQMILGKYDWKLPVFAEQYINDTIKLAFADVGLTREKKIKSGVKGEKATKVKLCDFVHFHTARSAYIDFMMNDMDVSAESLRKITGQSLKVLLGYERGDKKKNALKVGRVINKKLTALSDNRNEEE